MRTPVRKYWRSEERTNKQKNKRVMEVYGAGCWHHRIDKLRRSRKPLLTAMAKTETDRLKVTQYRCVGSFVYSISHLVWTIALALELLHVWESFFFFCLLCLFLLSLAIQWSCECAATTTTKSASGEILYLIGFMGLSAGLFNIRVQKF